MTGHAALARANFETGCNCAQAVLCAYPELLPRETAMKLGASLGGGIGRLREVCGAVSAIVLLAGEDSIREVIPFPMNKNAQDLMMDAPSAVDPKQLADVHIAIVEDK